MVDGRKLGWRRDWPALFYLNFAIIGFFVIAYDFWKIQGLRFQYLFVVVGFVLVIIGGSFRIKSRVALKKAGFGIVNSYKLQIVGGQRLVTDGIYSFIRHPLYLGEMTRNLGFAVLFASLYGFVFMVIANSFLIVRISIEERMLLDEFGTEYEEYRRRTKKLIPYIY